MERTVRRRKKRRINPVRLIFTVVVVTLLSLSAMSVKNIISLYRENRELTEQNAELEEEKSQLQNELDNADDLEYIEEQARQQLRMVKPGEVLYIIGEEGTKVGESIADDSGEDDE